MNVSLSRILLHTLISQLFLWWKADLYILATGTLGIINQVPSFRGYLSCLYNLKVRPSSKPYDPGPTTRPESLPLSDIS